MLLDCRAHPSSTERFALVLTVTTGAAENDPEADAWRIPYGRKGIS